MLYVLRHGKTDWNAEKRLQGRTDVPLNDEGRKMAEKAAYEYRDVPFDICYCSPLIRAKETAEILLAGRDVPIVFDDRLQEMCFGVYEGLANSFQIPDCPINVLFQDPASYKGAEGAETFEELFARTGAFLREEALPKVRVGKDVLIVGHGAMNSSIVCQILNRPISEFWNAGIENCKLKKLL